jgi:hypothetical protein
MGGGTGAALPLGDFTVQAGASFRLLEGAPPARPARGREELPALPFPPAAFAPALRAQLLLAEFAAAWWRRRDDPAYALAPPRRTAPGTESLRAQVTALIRAAEERPARMGEILAQSDAMDGYWLQIMMAHTGARPAIATLVAAATLIGQMAGMYWKRHYMAPRPVQVYPALMPVIPTPAHPAFPSNHSLQAHLIAHLLTEAFPATPERFEAVREPLLRLAGRIARNREIAGVHFEEDSDAGEALAARLLPLILGLPGMREALRAAQAEMGGVMPGDPPDPIIKWPPVDAAALPES